MGEGGEPPVTGAKEDSTGWADHRRRGILIYKNNIREEKISILTQITDKLKEYGGPRACCSSLLSCRARTGAIVPKNAVFTESWGIASE